jgi:hypothetical protein
MTASFVDGTSGQANEYGIIRMAKEKAEKNTYYKRNSNL